MNEVVLKNKKETSSQGSLFQENQKVIIKIPVALEIHSTGKFAICIVICIYTLLDTLWFHH